jgi:hypothetical protein
MADVGLAVLSVDLEGTPERLLASQNHAKTPGYAGEESFPCCDDNRSQQKQGDRLNDMPLLSRRQSC